MSSLTPTFSATVRGGRRTAADIVRHMTRDRDWMPDLPRPIHKRATSQSVERGDIESNARHSDRLAVLYRVFTGRTRLSRLPGQTAIVKSRTALSADKAKSASDLKIPSPHHHNLAYISSFHEAKDEQSTSRRAKIKPPSYSPGITALRPVGAVGRKNFGGGLTSKSAEEAALTLFRPEKHNIVLKSPEKVNRFDFASAGLPGYSALVPSQSMIMRLTTKLSGSGVGRHVGPTSLHSGTGSKGFSGANILPEVKSSLSKNVVPRFGQGHDQTVGERIDMHSAANIPIRAQDTANGRGAAPVSLTGQIVIDGREIGSLVAGHLVEEGGQPARGTTWFNPSIFPTFATTRVPR